LRGTLPNIPIIQINWKVAAKRDFDLSLPITDPVLSLDPFEIIIC